MRGHTELAGGRWTQMTLIEQLANIGAEVNRAVRARERDNESRFAAALDRALELFDLSLADQRWRGARRREIARSREIFCDYVVGLNEFGSSPQDLDAYYLPFAVAARRGR